MVENNIEGNASHFATCSLLSPVIKAPTSLVRESHGFRVHYSINGGAWGWGSTKVPEKSAGARDSFGSIQ